MAFHRIIYCGNIFTAWPSAAIDYPCNYFRKYWTFSTYALVSDDLGVTESMGRSKNLVKGRWWNVFGYNLLFGLIILGVLLLMGVIFFLPRLLFNLIPVFEDAFNNLIDIQAEHT